MGLILHIGYLDVDQLTYENCQCQVGQCCQRLIPLQIPVPTSPLLKLLNRTVPSDRSSLVKIVEIGKQLVVLPACASDDLVSWTNYHAIVDVVLRTPMDCPELLRMLFWNC